MNAGKDVHTLMREIQLPRELKIGEFHGKVSWDVRAIWEEYSSWFHYDSTASLYGVPRSSIDADLVELAGRCGRPGGRAREKLAQARPLEAMHLLDIALGADPAHADSLAVKSRHSRIARASRAAANSERDHVARVRDSEVEAALARGA